MPRKDYYATLAVGRDATEEQVRQAYKRLARKYHPDVNPGDKAAEERFKEIAEAYAVLGNKQKRAEYDRPGPEGFDLGFDPSEIFRRARAGGFEAFDLGSLFGDLFGGVGAGGRTRRGASRGADLEATLEIGFEDAVRGSTVGMTLARGPERETIQVRIRPGTPDGARLRLPGKGQPGRAGGGPGDLYVQIQVRPHPVFRRDGDDLVCDVPLRLAEAALGGRVEVPTLDGSASMTVPPGTRSGQRFRLRGKGAPRARGGGHGDLYVVAQIVPPRELDAESQNLLRQFDARNPQPDLRPERSPR